MPPEDSTIVRRCQKCSVEKPLEAFYRSKDRHLGRAYVCKDCVKAHTQSQAERERRRKRQVKRYAATRETFYAMKDRPCADCGGRFPHYVMEFDHPDRSTKTGTISQMAMAGITPRFLAELAKCQLVCANCHRIRTRRQYERGEWKSGRPRFDGTHHTDDQAEAS